MNEFSIHRIAKLMGLEFVLHKKYYAMLAIGTFLFTLVFMLFVWYQNHRSATVFESHLEGSGSEQWVWEKGAYVGIFLGFKLLVLFLVIAQSFKELRSRSAAEFYLLVPASVFEKLISQFVFLIGLAEVVLPFIFWSAIQVARLIWTGFAGEMEGMIGVSNISLFELTLLLPEIKDQNWAVILLIYGFTILTISLLFAGSLYFGKWNVVLTPLSTFIFNLILAGSSIGLSQMLFEKEESIWSFNISIEQPEIFTDVPLMILLIIFLLYSASALSYVVTYFKLKEREV